MGLLSAMVLSPERLGSEFAPRVRRLTCCCTDRAAGEEASVWPWGLDREPLRDLFLSIFLDTGNEDGHPREHRGCPAELLVPGSPWIGDVGAFLTSCI